MVIFDYLWVFFRLDFDDIDQVAENVMKLLFWNNRGDKSTTNGGGYFRHLAES